MAESKYNLSGASFTGITNFDGTHHGNQTGIVHNYASEQNLVEATKEVQQIIEQLSQTNPTTTEAVTEAIHQEIKKNPTFKARLKGAFKGGGLEALKAIFNHPLFNIPAETIKGFIEAESE